LLDPPTDTCARRSAIEPGPWSRRALVDEVRAVRERHALSRTARQAIGYAEAIAVLDGAAPADRLVDAITTRTWRYARRQRSWFRADPRCVAVDPTLREAWTRSGRAPGSSRAGVAVWTYPRQVRFTKAHGAGNDFVVLADLDDTLALPAGLVRALTDRRRWDRRRRGAAHRWSPRRGCGVHGLPQR
jgi:hypothetical protein